MKRCTKCLVEKSDSSFPKNRVGRDGLYSKCKDCHGVDSKSCREAHRVRHQATPRADAPPIKQCKVCLAWKKSDSFHLTATSRDGLSRRCNECAADAQSLRLYGLPLGNYGRMLATQGGKCGICESGKTGSRGRFHVDHRHVSGFPSLSRDQKLTHVRALLCDYCNKRLGYLESILSWSAMEAIDLRVVPRWTELAIQYLRRHSRGS